MSKIAVLTIADYQNYGNRLQAYALQKLLQGERFEVSMGLDVFSKEEAIRKAKTPLKKAIKILLPVSLLAKVVERTKRMKLSEVEKERERRFHTFSAHYLNELPGIRVSKGRDVVRYISPNSFDYFIAGSDQVWNPFFAGEPWNFLQFARPDQRLSFAASIGIDKLPAEVVPRYREALSEMRYLSVREASAVRLIRELTGREAYVTLDPTLLLPSEEWDKLAQKPKTALPEHYILSFFLGELPPAVEIFSQECGLPVVYLNDQRFPELYVLDPSEYLYVLSRADYVLTDSFHGTALSIKLHRQFYVFHRVQTDAEDMFTRIEHILGRFGLKERVQMRERIVPGTAVDMARWDEIDKILAHERTVSMAQLLENMKNGGVPL